MAVNERTSRTPGQVRVGIIGCGNIAGPYAQDLVRYPHVELVGVADIDPARAQKLARQHHCRAYPTVEALLADRSIDLAVNLTIFNAHEAITMQCLEAGKHVYSEKPLALSYEGAARLNRLAQQKRLRLGCSPFTILGQAQQTAWKWVREGKLGMVRLVYAEINQGRIETWHPEPQPFYEVGVLFDVGGYPLTILTTILGPVRRVWAFGKVIHPERVTKRGVPFRITTPDLALAALEMSNGTMVRLTANMYLNHKTRQGSGIEFHGDEGSLHLGSWLEFDSPVEFARYDRPYEPVPYLIAPERGVPWGRGVAEMAQAMLDGRPHRITGEQAAHIVEVIAALMEALQTGRCVDVRSDFAIPAPMDWAA